MSDSTREGVAARCPETFYENATDCPVCLGEPADCPVTREVSAAFKHGFGDDLPARADRRAGGGDAT